MELTLLRAVLRELCPHLIKMAAQTQLTLDDFVVKIICTIAGYDEPDEEP